MKAKIPTTTPLFILLGAALLASSCARMETTGSHPSATAVDPVVAKGRGFEIRRSELNQVLRSVTANNPADQLPADAPIHAINQLIEIQLVLQKATDAEKAEGQGQADQTFTNILKTTAPEEFARRLKDSGMTADDLHLKLAQEATAQISLTRQLGISVTDAEVEKYYDDNPVVSEQPEKARIRELLLLMTTGYSSDPLPADVVQAKHRQIFDLYKRFRAGEDFTTLARQYNEDPASKAGGGELTFSHDQVEFGDLAFSMQTNAVSQVLTNSDGYRIFQVLEKIPARKIPFAEMSGRIKSAFIRYQQQSRAPAYLKQLKNEAGVEILDPALKQP